ncbi:DUF58 domain-containing protein [Nocardioides dongxiaopingii]|jgi:uncharacterized protein (DUF58 family)|uniref:DUF58 domain-containing protein n=1 Tax=Nocardioides sp. S-1144 TaxID=2582905 RepID=UPI00110D4F20|nr:DUF58 domain-containing protein [Nocardioides sp. S-1144]QCW49967.1 DUF58 domain-containing protein [Nocardioides sp. S-1144]
MLPVWSSTTGRGRAMLALGLVLLVAGTAWGYLLVAGLGGCLVLLVLVEVTAVLSARRVAVERTIEPAVVVRQGRCEGTIAVRGRRRRGLVRLDVADRVQGTLVPVALPDRADEVEEADRVAGEPTVRVRYQVPTPRRGLVDVGPVQVRMAGLTGMAARSAEHGRVDQVRVLPRRIPLGAMMAGTRRSLSGGDDAHELGGTDLVGLHEYAMGDDLRRLHWATSARTGTLMVREDAEPSEAHVTVLLDDRASSYLGDENLFEEAVELAAALCRSGIEAGSPVRLHTTSDRHEVRVPGSVGGRPRREHQELDWVLAEIDLTGPSTQVELHGRDLDVAVGVTGPGADLHLLGLALGTAPTRVLAVVDPAPLVGAHQEAGLLVLRGATSVTLALGWDEAVER